MPMMGLNHTVFASSSRTANWKLTNHSTASTTSLDNVNWLTCHLTKYIQYTQSHQQKFIQIQNKNTIKWIHESAQKQSYMPVSIDSVKSLRNYNNIVIELAR